MLPTALSLASFLSEVLFSGGILSSSFGTLILFPVSRNCLISLQVSGKINKQINKQDDVKKCVLL